ncbi:MULTISPECIES: methyl-accepting chemotaxis protein [unclassified Paenibacillus]|uniref:methyl-accepting chemotaxis protein n=1 Tax=unclassified Paenibacillus TaxID=185978 RepID=UPI000CFC826C|nr:MULTISPECIES: methyl-accepting chemotaxis protein [unclassified Paenibacillus]PRA02074.1 methyl-accepting chemotaxis protein [Paenibacillus sp. MYb63]PRA44951.1 methyl-accepting chemotaxis protein [Paenibacillus sp. MYb67]QZN75964.1 methyl-accepting chemotaxis protein [Paenibacillus sp. DR312]
MKKISISRKLLMGFSSVLLLLVAITVITYTQFIAVEKTYTELINDRTSKLLLIKNMSIDLKSQQIALRNYILEDNAENEQAFNKAYEDYIAINEELKSTVSSSKMKDYLSRSDEAMSRYYELAQQIMTLTRQGNNSEISRLLKDTAPSLISEFEGIVEGMETHQQDAMNSGVVEANLQIVQVLRWIAIIGVASLLIGALVAYVIGRMISLPVAAVAQSASRIAAGDLTGEPIVVRNKDEIGDLAQAFNIMSANLRTLIHQVGDSAERVAASSEELTASTEQTATATEQVAITMGEIATGMDTQVRMASDGFQTMNELTTGFQQVTENTLHMSEEATKVSVKTISGSESVQSAIGQMNSIQGTVSNLSVVIQELSRHSQDIVKMVDSISEISAQTNLLSLNAAIEAARAGEQGRGFQVVATEVRKLSEQSALSANQIVPLVASIEKGMRNAAESMVAVSAEVQEGIALVHQAGATFDEIREAVGSVAGQTQEVSASIEQMSTGVEQINRSMKTIMEVTETGAAGTEEVSASSEEQLSAMQEIASAANDLSLMAEQLQQTVSRFKVQ